MVATDFKDYYAILGVSKTATAEEIKTAYRKLARQYHPDLNPGDKAAEERFKEINEAHEVLSDPDKRRQYEQFGQYWQATREGRRSTGGGVEGFDFGRYGNFEEFINELLGRFAGSPGQRVYTYRTTTGAPGGFRDMDDRWGGNLRSEIPAADTETAIALTLSEAFHGVQKRLHIDGETLTVQIPAGVKTGSRIRLKGKGRTTPFSKQRGDLYLTVELLPHPFFKVVDHDLHCEVPITPDEAALGTEIPIPTPEGRVALKIPPGVRSGQSLRLRSKGWCHPKGPRGDQLVKLQVVLPKDLSDRERECYKKLRAYRSYNPRSQLDQVTL